MTIEQITRTMQKRMPWRSVEHILASNGIARGRGYDNTLHKMIENAKHIEQKIPALRAAIRDHIICGEKLVEFYRFDEEDISAIRKLVSESTPDTGPMTDAYPLALSDREISKADLGDSILVAIERTDDGIAAVYSTI